MKTLFIALNPESVSADQLAQIKALAPKMEVLVTQDRAEMETALPNVEIAVAGFPRAFILRAPNLRWVQQWGAGADWLINHPEVVDRNFILTNASGIHAIPISEHILAFMLSFARGFYIAARNQAEGQWRGVEDRHIFELAGKTVVLIGVGAIGERTAVLASALGMKVIGVRYNRNKPADGVDEMVGPDQLLTVLPEGDFVVLTVPLTPASKNMIGETELRAMKPTSYIINIGRGGTIDQEMLVRALQENWIAGAGLDVTTPEPLPSDSPLWEMENVIITAHYSGATPYYNQRAMAIFLDNLARYGDGRPLCNVVDKQLAY